MSPTLHPQGRHHVRGRRWTRLALALVAAMTLYVGPAVSAMPTDTRQHPTSVSAAKPTIVFVHGAFADASGWGQEVVALQRLFIPDAGQSILTSYDPTLYPGSLLGPDTVVVRPVSNPAAPGGQDADVYIAPASFRSVFAGDQSRVVAEMMAATQRPLSYFAQTEASGEPAWRTVPSWALVTLDDRAISPGGQRFMAQRAGSHIQEVRSAHDVMVSHPDAVVKVVLRAVRAVG